MTDEIKALNARIDVLEGLLREVLQRLPSRPREQPQLRILPRHEYVEKAELDGSKGI